MQFDVRDPQFRADPYPFYELLQANVPVFYWEEWGVWFLTRYEDCNNLLRDNRLGRGEMSGFPDAERALWEMMANWMLVQDPPDHTRLRGLVHKAFTPRIVEQMRDDIQTITDGLLDEVQDNGRMDIIADLAYPLPVTVIARMFDVPEKDYKLFHGWSNALGRTLDFTDNPDVYSAGTKAAEEFIAYLRDLVAERRKNLGKDLLSALIQAREAGDSLTEDELFATCTLLLTAGHETTINLIGNGTLALLRHPDQMARLKENPGLMKTAVEELLRYDSPVQATARIVYEDVEVGDLTLTPRAQVNFMLGAANRDPARFENPDQLDLGRQPNPHLAFGSGIHYCLGAPLARLEGQIAFTTLLNRMPNLRLETDSPKYRDNFTLRGLEALPVSF
ncbi:MAG: cytochrome P450 [Candidatus Promineifilaceae bacterium]